MLKQLALSWYEELVAEIEAEEDTRLGIDSIGSAGCLAFTVG